MSKIVSNVSVVELAQAFNAGATVESESLKPVKESVVSVLELQNDDGLDETTLSIDLEKVSRYLIPHKSKEGKVALTSGLVSAVQERFKWSCNINGPSAAYFKTTVVTLALGLASSMKTSG
ncbi:hypothetical protein RIF29_20637 [Crotalaria pallida]|uniref:Uncharacterized protein n=1 Tax=Crotalaria pallida TaxID=3830 RepID=A0AAN9ICM2_CROPI